jgi:TorA maturation chaperone TorD
LSNEISKNERRANLYSLFSRLLLQEVDEEVVEFLKKSESTFDIFPNLKDWKPWNELSNRDLVNKYLNVDFTDISLLHLVPYETFYTRDDQMVETGGANPVTNFYHEYGFKVEYDNARVVSADHIGVELEFLSKLILAEIEAGKDGDSESAKNLIAVQKRFIKEHLINWVSLYLINVKFEARTPLYHDLAEATLSFILEDWEELSK